MVKTKTKARPVSRDEAVREIERVPPDAPDQEAAQYRSLKNDTEAPPADRQPFGRFVLSLRNREGWVQALADGARADPKFPKDGDPEDVRARLRETMAEGDMFEAVDDAEADWLSY